MANHVKHKIGAGTIACRAKALSALTVSDPVPVRVDAVGARPPWRRRVRHRPGPSSGGQCARLAIIEVAMLAGNLKAALRHGRV